MQFAAWYDASAPDGQQIGRHLRESQQWQVSKSGEMLYSHLRFANFYAKLHQNNGSHSQVSAERAICSQNRAWANWLRFGNASAADSHAVSDPRDSPRFMRRLPQMKRRRVHDHASPSPKDKRFFGGGRRRDRPPQQLAPPRCCVRISLFFFYLRTWCRALL